MWYGSLDPRWRSDRLISHAGHWYALIARTKAATGGEKRRPATVTSETSRTTSGSISGRVCRPGSRTEYSGRKADADAGHHHGLDPVLALAAIDMLRLDALLLAQRA